MPLEIRKQRRLVVVVEGIYYFIGPPHEAIHGIHWQVKPPFEGADAERKRRAVALRDELATRTAGFSE